MLLASNLIQFSLLSTHLAFILLRNNSGNYVQGNVPWSHFNIQSVTINFLQQIFARVTIQIMKAMLKKKISFFFLQ